MRPGLLGVLLTPPPVSCSGFEVAEPATLANPRSELPRVLFGKPCAIYLEVIAHVGDGRLREQVQEVARFAQETGVTICAVDPRGLPGAVVADTRVDPLVWKDYLNTTRETLRMLSQPTGGFVLFEFADVSQALDGIGAALRK